LKRITTGGEELKSEMIMMTIIIIIIIIIMFGDIKGETKYNSGRSQQSNQYILL
jgi:hypothetical protein